MVEALAEDAEDGVPNEKPEVLADEVCVEGAAVDAVVGVELGVVFGKENPDEAVEKGKAKLEFEEEIEENKLDENVVVEADVDEANKLDVVVAAEAPDDPNRDGPEFVVDEDVPKVMNLNLQRRRMYQTGMFQNWPQTKLLGTKMGCSKYGDEVAPNNGKDVVPPNKDEPALEAAVDTAPNRGEAELAAEETVPNKGEGEVVEDETAPKLFEPEIAEESACPNGDEVEPDAEPNRDGTELVAAGDEPKENNKEAEEAEEDEEVESPKPNEETGGAELGLELDEVLNANDNEVEEEEEDEELGFAEEDGEGEDPKWNLAPVVADPNEEPEDSNEKGDEEDEEEKPDIVALSSPFSFSGISEVHCFEKRIFGGFGC
ncbi:hypothetical protein GH714_018984 [Hevea brasiliensis]|uniref:Uncharacterized protein n=1 Tax=Hevea brasiliensis TaxID=3981 RepID=A0A6A6LSS5_HEVBR|nr:hypothetical protein GH714_018984 [Hevea brasiliensis]